MKKETILVFFLLIILPFVTAVADLQVTAFSCAPDEVKLNELFTCTATVKNVGDANGNLNTATLYPDGTNWLESNSYSVTVNSVVNSGASTEVNFNSLRGKKSGDNGFSKIMLDEVTDTYVADNSVKVNVIDVAVVGTSSSGNANSGASVDVTAQGTVGGNVDLTLSFSATGGGCSIGGQGASTTTEGMTNGQTASKTWSVTLGTASCQYSLSAQVTSNPDGTATKTDTTSGTITCSNCGGGGSGDDGDGGSSVGGGGGGASSTTAAVATKTAEKEQSKASSETTKDAKTAEVPVPLSETETGADVTGSAQGADKESKGRLSALAGRAFGQLSAVLVDLSWLWVTVVIVAVGIGLIVYLKRKL